MILFWVITYHIEAGHAVLSMYTAVCVAGFLALWSKEPLSDAPGLIHITGIQGILYPALHTAVAHSPVACGRTLAVDTRFVEVPLGVPRWGDENDSGGGR